MSREVNRIGVGETRNKASKEKILSIQDKQSKIVTVNEYI